ncbi:MAG: multidrug resistance protein SMR [Thermobacillus sp. ZCTH02-B1]|uniref:DMT family transporter n=1 Tax=Thermobacillus sp. ZCTH02-B1 TaxID=1858795 RepID=UPI000B57EF0C|nr:multidrug efflux SMR transporter [Thermobacillus sp. ZCTH02-B1]OUM96149.1 MAG: multidrug resistance protein SMR [Thermobacillus sp. ZCTH02-B1]
MNRHWMLVFIAAACEIGWVTGLKYADSAWQRALTIAAILLSFALLIRSGKKLPAATAYAVFVGLGTAGTVVTETLFFGVPFSPVKAALIASLLVGIIGLKIVTPPGDGPERRESR